MSARLYAFDVAQPAHTESQRAALARLAEGLLAHAEHVSLPVCINRVHVYQAWVSDHHWSADGLRIWLHFDHLHDRRPAVLWLPSARRPPRLQGLLPHPVFHVEVQWKALAHALECHVLDGPGAAPEHARFAHEVWV